MAPDIFFYLFPESVCSNATSFKRQEELFFGHKRFGPISTSSLFNPFEEVVCFKMVNGIVVNKKRKRTLFGHQMLCVFYCVLNLIRHYLL